MTDDFIDGDDEDLFDTGLAERAEEAAKQKVAELDDAVVSHLQTTEQTYRRVFEHGNASKGDLDFVLADLAWFVRLDEHYFDSARMQDVMAGRKQVLQRIMEYTRLDHNTLVKRYIETQS